MSYTQNVRDAAAAPKRDPLWLRTWYWPLYIVVAILGFAIPEAIAIVSKGDGGTKSDKWREWLGVGANNQSKDLRVGWGILAAVLILFAIWFPVHLREWWPWERGVFGS